jgi:Tfp pilus assembly protein PilO
MNLAELSKLDINDLKNVDYKKLFWDLKDRPDVIVNIVAVLLTLIFILTTFSGRQNEINKLKSDAYQLEEKANTITAYESAKKDLAEIQKNLPPNITDTDFINFVTDLAIKRNIKLTSFLPGKGESSTFYDSLVLSIDFSAKDYGEMWHILHDIEQSPYAIRVENWSGMLTNKVADVNRKAGEAETLAAKINVKLRISAINVKKNE